MVLFRCTQRLAKRFRLRLAQEPPTSSGLLGDWYANLLNVGRNQLVLCLSERTLLPVLLPARQAEFPIRFADYLTPLLEHLEVPQHAIRAEANAAREWEFAPTRSRSVLGALNDFATGATFRLQHPSPPATLLEAALELAQTPSKPIQYESPQRVVQSLFQVAGRA